MIRKSLLLAATLAACSAPPDYPPGDDQAVEWVMPDRSCDDSPGPVIDCAGGTRQALVVSEDCTTVRNCTVLSGIAIGVFQSPVEILAGLTYRDDYVSRIREIGVYGTLIEDVTIEADGRRLPLYVGLGSVGTTIRRTTIRGESRSTMVYLGAESTRTTIEDCTIDGTRASRETVAVDASDHNVLARNRIIGEEGIYLYRNCGEDARTRVTTPSDNLFVRNRFNPYALAVWLGSRTGLERPYCGDDDGLAPFGSAVSNASHARRNAVTGSPEARVIETSGSDNFW